MKLIDSNKSGCFAILSCHVIPANYSKLASTLDIFKQFFIYILSEVDFKRNTPLLAAVGMKGMRIQLRIWISST